MKLNIGSGGRPLKKNGWVDVDIRADVGADIVADGKDLPLDDCVADEILAHSILEHCGKWEYKKYLKEWYRVLKPGGILKISVPDMKRIAEKIVEGENYYNYINFTYGEQDYPENLHRWGWTEKSLKEDLQKVGLVKFRRLPNTRYHCELFVKVTKI